METEQLNIEIPVSLRMELEKAKEDSGRTLKHIITRALELYVGKLRIR